jgi:GntR family transcriptional regulator, carbon starvation induced regulator
MRQDTSERVIAFAAAAFPADGEPTLTERATNLLRRAILSGVLQPGEKLAIHALAERFKIGTTPIREGLSRLVEPGLVVASGQRGFRVTEISAKDLAEIVRLRRVVEVEALQASIRDGDDTWEAAIVSSLHRIKRFMLRHPETTAGSGEEFDAIHREFHMALIGACGSARLLALCGSLFDQSHRYRCVAIQQIDIPRKTFDKEHEDLAFAAIERKTDDAVARLHEHLQTTIRLLYPDFSL